MVSVDASWSAWVATLPDDLSEAARDLTWHLALTEERGASWHEYTRLEAMYDLPLFVTDARDERVERFRVAHHHAGFYGLVVDRVADGQVRSPGAVARLVEPLRDGWIEALTHALGDRSLARDQAERSVARWREGLRRERELLASGAFSEAEYGRVVVAKCAWLTLAGELLARRLFSADVARRWERAARLLMIAVQSIDDGVDAEEDLRLRGASPLRGLGVSSAALLRSGAMTLRVAEREATAGGFTRLARWLAEHSAAVIASAPRCEGAEVFDAMRISLALALSVSS